MRQDALMWQQLAKVQQHLGHVHLKPFPFPVGQRQRAARQVRCPGSSAAAPPNLGYSQGPVKQGSVVQTCPQLPVHMGSLSPV